MLLSISVSLLLTEILTYVNYMLNVTHTSNQEVEVKVKKEEEYKKLHLNPT